MAVELIEVEGTRACFGVSSQHESWMMIHLGILGSFDCA